MSAQPKLRYTLEDYFELERTSEARYEYWNGEVFDMSGVSHKHALIEVNLTFSLASLLREIEFPPQPLLSLVPGQ